MAREASETRRGLTVERCRARSHSSCTQTSPSLERRADGRISVELVNAAVARFTRDVTADNGFEWNDFGLAYQHRAALEDGFVLLYFERHFIDVRGDEVRRDDVLELLKPEE